MRHYARLTIICIAIALPSLHASTGEKALQALKKIPVTKTQGTITTTARRWYKEYKNQAFMKQFMKKNWRESLRQTILYSLKHKPHPVPVLIGKISADLSNRHEIINAYPGFFKNRLISKNIKDLSAFASQLIEDNPELGSAFFLKAIIYTYIKKSDPQKALYHLKKSIKYDAQNAHAFAYAGFFYSKLKKKRNDLNNIKTQASLYRHALKLKSTCYPALYNLAYNSLITGDSKTARKLAWKAVKASPFSGHAQNLLLYMYTHTGQNPKAFLREIKQQAGSNARILWSFGQAFRSKKAYRTASIMTLRAFKLEKNRQLKVQIGAEALEYARKLKQRRTLNRVSKAMLKTGIPDAFFYVAMQLYIDGQYKTAIVLLKKIENSRTYLTPRYQVYSNLGTLYFRTGKKKMAKKYLQKALQIKKTDAVSLFNLGYIYYKEGKKKKARFYMNKIVQYYRGTIYERKAKQFIKRRL